METLLDLFKTDKALLVVQKLNHVLKELLNGGHFNLVDKISFHSLDLPAKKLTLLC